MLRTAALPITLAGLGLACSADDTGGDGGESGATSTAASADDATIGTSQMSMTGLDPTGSSTTSGPSPDSGDDDDQHSCPEDCCHDDITIVVGGARESFSLRFDDPGLTFEPTIACPDGPHDVPSYWVVACEPGQVNIDADGVFTSNGVTVSVNAQPSVPVELDFMSCNCNCQPLGGVVDASGASGGSSSSSDSGTSTAGDSSTG